MSRATVAAGTLRHPITIERYTQSQNAFGEVIEAWGTLLSTHADIQPIRGKEYFESKSINAEVTHRVILRYQAEIKPSDRVIFNTRVFQIESVINVDERNILHELICIETI